MKTLFWAGVVFAFVGGWIGGWVAGTKFGAVKQTFKTEIQRSETGSITRITTYFTDSSGSKILHGTQYEWELPNRLRIDEYREGRKVDGRWESYSP